MYKKYFVKKLKKKINKKKFFVNQKFMKKQCFFE